MGQFWTVPNVLSLLRILGLPFLLYLIWHHQWVPSLVLAGIMGATDWFDGYIARNFHQVSNWGGILDPLGDKLMIGGLLILYTMMGFAPLFLTVILLTKNVSLIVAGAVMKKRYPQWQPQVLYISKLLTVLWEIYLYGILILQAMNRWDIITQWGGNLLFSIGIALLSIIVWGLYTIKAVHFIQAQR